jgi:hypothetical protein
MNFGLLVQTRPMPTIAGAAAHPSQIRPWSERLTRAFMTVFQTIRIGAPLR